MSGDQACTRCVMTSKADPTIRFDEKGFCNYCTKRLNQKDGIYFPNERGARKIEEMLSILKKEGEGKSCDCLMGISGGLDSTYLAYLGTRKWGLRITAVHVDDGFDTEIAQKNIRKLCDACGVDLQVVKPDRKQFRELSRAYMLAGVPNLAVPQDNVLFACLHQYAREHGIRHFLSGGNFALESILQSGNTCDAYDIMNLRDINKKHGRDGIDKLDLLDNWRRQRDNRLKRVTELRPLNYIDYNRERALRELAEDCGFEYYGAKHLENYFTTFLQLYWLPKKFGVDKRTSHFSSMIVSGQMTREEAMEKLKEPLYDDVWMDRVILMIKRELDFSDQEFNDVMAMPNHQHSDYRMEWVFPFYLRIRHLAARIIYGAKHQVCKSG